MTPRQKCPHCGKIADFHEDFCTLCWSHRTKGKVLNEEQITACQGQFAVATEKKRWEAEFGVWQNRLLIPAILMTLWCLYGVSVLLPVYLKFGAAQAELALGLLCAAAFAVGGYLVGGSKAIRFACAVLIIPSLGLSVYLADYLLDVVLGNITMGKGFVFSSIRLAFCGIILVSSVMILRIKRPVA